MLLDGPSHAVKHVGIQSQLRSVILAFSQHHSAAATPRIAVWRTFSTTRSLRSANEADLVVKDGSQDNRTTKHLYPGGRIIGKPGRRQRASSSKLAISSLGKSSSVIVIRDLDESRQLRTRITDNLIDEIHDTPFHSEPEKELHKEEEAVPSENVFESIDQLRPKDSFLDEQGFATLSRRLAQGYTQPQLRVYLRRSLLASQAKHQQKDSSAPSASVWCAGRSPLVKRLPMPQKPAIHKRKDDIIDQILRNAWLLSVHSEEQEIGEQEIPLPVHFADLLCTQVLKDTRLVPMWQTLLSSPLLARSVELQNLSETGIIRLVGRRQDTNQVIQELCAELASMPSLAITSDTLKNLSGRAPQDLNVTLSPRVLEEIGRKSSTSIARADDGILSITGIKAWQCQHARAIIYNLLGIEHDNHQQTTCMVDTLFSKDGAGKAPQPTSVPVFLDRRMNGLSSLQHGRLALPLQRVTHRAKQAPHSSDLTLIGRLAECVAYTDTFISDAYSPGVPIGKTLRDQKGVDMHFGTSDLCARTRWEAEIGLLLHEPSLLIRNSPETPGTFASQSPFSDALLDLFAIHQHVDGKKAAGRLSARSIVAHLLPLNTTNTVRLPSLELHFWLGRMSQDGFVFKSLIAKLAQHRIQIRLPAKCADIQLLKKVELRVKDPQPLLADLGTQQALQRFSRAIQSQDAVTPLAAMQDLVPSMSLRIQLPTQMLPPGHVITNDDDWLYTVSHFEFLDSTDYVPSHLDERLGKGTRSVAATHLAEWHSQTYLNITESDAGAFGNRRRDVRVCCNRKPSNSTAGGATLADQSAEAKAVFGSASCLVDMMTAASRE